MSPYRQHNPASGVTMIRPACESSSDANVQAAVCDLYRNSSYEFSRVRCEVHGGTALLGGRVSSYFLKQMAQELIRSANELDVRAIENRLDVDSNRQ